MKLVIFLKKNKYINNSCFLIRIKNKKNQKKKHFTVNLMGLKKIKLESQHGAPKLFFLFFFFLISKLKILPSKLKKKTKTLKF